MKICREARSLVKIEKKNKCGALYMETFRRAQPTR